MIEIGVNLDLAVSLLKEGNLVGLPTETVYGLGADAANPEALERLFRAKGRPRSHPVIVHIAGAGFLEDWVENVPPSVEKLAERFWPGPLTIIFKKRSTVCPEVTGGQDTVAIRVPRHPLTLSLLERFGGGIAAPSANKFGKLSPTSAVDVAREFENQVAYVLDGGSCDVGIESTILDLSGTAPAILRPGMISQKDLEEVLGTVVPVRSAERQPSVKASGSSSSSIELATETSGDDGEPILPRVPGSHKSHYAPNTPVRLLDSHALEDALTELIKLNLRPGVLAFATPKATLNSIPWIVAEEEPEGYAKHLYSNLRQLDDCRCDWILIEQVPESAAWQGIADRLTRASHPNHE